MNVKILSVIAVLALLLAGWFFYSHKSEKPAVALAKPDISSEVSEIKAVQTNPDTGETEYTLTAKSLIQNSKTGQDELIDVTMDWQPPNGQLYHITTKRATLNQATGEMLLSDGFSLVRDAIDDKPLMTMTGNVLHGNTKERKVWSDETLNVVQGADSFHAKSMKADLVLGEYEFNQIEIEYTAPTRVDKPLF